MWHGFVYGTLASVFVSLNVGRIFQLPAFSKHGYLVLVAGVVQEHKVGRWWEQKQTKNGMVSICL